jgi:hypothetical protein
VVEENESSEKEESVHIDPVNIDKIVYSCNETIKYGNEGQQLCLYHDCKKYILKKRYIQTYFAFHLLF